MWSKRTTKGKAFHALLHLPIWAFRHSDAGEAVVDDGSEKIPLMAFCIFVVRCGLASTFEIECCHKSHKSHQFPVALSPSESNAQKPGF
eukprot:s1162_g21.t1